jgi:hypothetical protein
LLHLFTYKTPVCCEILLACKNLLRYIYKNPCFVVKSFCSENFLYYHYRKFAQKIPLNHRALDTITPDLQNHLSRVIAVRYLLLLYFPPSIRF